MLLVVWWSLWRAWTLVSREHNTTTLTQMVLLESSVGLACGAVEQYPLLIRAHPGRRRGGACGGGARVCSRAMFHLLAPDTAGGPRRRRWGRWPAPPGLQSGSTMGGGARLARRWLLLLATQWMEHATWMVGARRLWQLHSFSLGGGGGGGGLCDQAGVQWRAPWPPGANATFMARHPGGLVVFVRPCL